LIGSVSHELRTPLASILGGVSIMAEMPTITKDPRLASLASGIRDEAMRLNSDIQNLLDAALISSQGLHSRRDWTDPTDIIDTAVERMRRRFSDRRITLSLGSNLPLVHIDPCPGRAGAEPDHRQRGKILASAIGHRGRGLRQGRRIADFGAG
jgi:two-component system sensor histidine kinase KdpD